MKALMFLVALFFAVPIVCYAQDIEYKEMPDGTYEEWVKNSDTNYTLEDLLTKKEKLQLEIDYLTAVHNKLTPLRVKLLRKAVSKSSSGKLTIDQVISLMIQERQAEIGQLPVSE